MGSGKDGKWNTEDCRVDQTIEKVRKIVTELRPSILDELGFCAAIEWQLSQFQERTGISGFFESSSDNFDISRDIAAALFTRQQVNDPRIVRHYGYEGAPA